MSDCFIFAYKFIYFVFTESILRNLTIRKSWLTTFVLLGFFFFFETFETFRNASKQFYC